MRYSSIDIGTNTLRLLIAESDPKGGLTPLVYERAITRLGGGYTEERGIDPISAKRTLAVLEGFRKIITENNVENVAPVATSVVRRAVNRGWFLGEVFKRTGLKVEVISGSEEARLTVLGVLSVIGGNSRALIMDIGGGSTEFVATEGRKILGSWSMEMGVVHLTEDFLMSDPPSGEELRAMEDSIGKVIGELKDLMAKDNIDPSGYSGKQGAIFVGTAGTATTLAAIDQDLEVYDPEKINNYVLSSDTIRRMYRELSALEIKEREKILSLEKGREDLIIPGTAICFTVADGFGFEDMLVSDSGLLEGIILDRLKTTTIH